MGFLNYGIQYNEINRNHWNHLTVCIDWIDYATDHDIIQAKGRFMHESFKLVHNSLR
jgi:hypothetical protein